MNNQYQEYLKTDYWKAVAKAVKVKAGYKCQVCNSPHDLNAHHRTYEHRGNELEHLGDLVCLCRRCHVMFHGKTEEPQKARPKIKYDEARVDRWVAHNSPIYSQAVVDHDAIERDMPPGDGDITLNKDLVNRCRTARGGFTGATVRAFGVKFPLPSGWATRLRGTVIRRAKYQDALLGRYLYGTKANP